MVVRAVRWLSSGLLAAVRWSWLPWLLLVLLVAGLAAGLLEYGVGRGGVPGAARLPPPGDLAAVRELALGADLGRLERLASVDVPAGRGRTAGFTVYRLPETGDLLFAHRLAGRLAWDPVQVPFYPCMGQLEFGVRRGAYAAWRRLEVHLWDQGADLLDQWRRDRLDLARLRILVVGSGQAGGLVPLTAALLLDCLGHTGVRVVPVTVDAPWVVNGPFAAWLNKHAPGVSVGAARGRPWLPLGYCPVGWPG